MVGILVAAGDDLCGAAANVKPAGIHRGQTTWQTVEKFQTVESCKPDLARHINATVVAVQKAARTDHVIGIIQKINIRIARQNGRSHLAPLQKRRAARVIFAVDQVKTRPFERLFKPFQPLAGAKITGHLGAQKGDAAVARRNNRLGHLTTGAPVRNAHGTIHWRAVDIHDLDHGNSGLGHHRPGGSAVFKPGDDDA